MQDRRKQKRREAGKGGYKTVRMQKLRDKIKKGCMIGRMLKMKDARREMQDALEKRWF